MQIFFKAISAVLPIIVLQFSASSVSADTPDSLQISSASDTVVSVIISGNKKTKAEVVLQISGVSVGMNADSTLVTQVKRRLIRSGLFSKTDVLLHRTPAGTRVYIILNEKFYFLPYDFGGELYGYRYGQRKTWWRLRIGMEYNNFRGKAEVLRTHVSFWDWRSLGLGWYKPLLPTPYYFSAGASVNVLPDQVFRIDHTILRGSTSFGRKLPYNSRLDLSLIPLYRRRIEFDSLLVPSDTVRVYEAFSMLRFITDHRNRLFDPDKGWLVSANIQTNALYTRVAPPFCQLTFDLRAYLPGVIPSHKLAFRSTATIRDTDAGTTHRMIIGGEGTIRGYSQNQFGRYFYANDCFTLACEYRFPMFTIRNIPMYHLDDFYPALASISYRFDGALIVDYGRIAGNYKDLFSPDGNKLESGTGMGFGLRLVIPELEHSGCFDVVWGTNPWSHQGYLTFLERPMWHLYLDMFF